MRRRKKTSEDDAAYVGIDAVSGGITQLTDDGTTAAEQRRTKAKVRQKSVRPIGFVHPGDGKSGGQ